jgi:lysophospholipase L1-like esterase
MRTSIVLPCLLAALLATAARGPAADLGDIMPLGDSITLGVPVSGGYRDPLMRNLTNGGFQFRFVGSLSDYATVALTAATQQWHEGHSGYIIDGRNLYCSTPTRSGLYENMAAWLSGTNPSNILLMIGSNDINLDYCSTNAPDRLSGLISLISNPTNGLEPVARLYVASIVPMNTSTGTEPRVQAFNAALPGIVAAHQSNGENVVFVNMHDRLGFADLADNLHPNAAGYGKMADVWFEALTGLTNSPPTNSPPNAVISGTNVSAATDNSAAAGFATAGFFGPWISTNDLIDTNSVTLASWIRDKTPLFETTTLNDGRGHPTNSAAGTYLPATFGAGAKLPFTYTFTLNTAASPYGYDLTEIRSFAGWNQNGAQLGNQTYEVLVRRVNQPEFESLGVVAYVPFDGSVTANASATMVTLTPTSPALAVNAQEIRFVLMSHGIKHPSYGPDGTVYFEVDAFGAASTSPPPVGAVLLTGACVAAETDNSAAAGYPTAGHFGPWISTSDLIDTNSATLASWSRDKAPFFETTTLNDGRGHPTNAAAGTFLPATFGTGDKLPFSYTYALNTNASPDGYDVTEIRTFAGWNQNGAQLGNQKYEVLVRPAGDGSFVSLGTFTYTPFVNTNTEEASSTMVTLTPSSGLVLASGVDQVRFVWMDHGYKRSSIDGTVYFEADVYGQPTVLDPPPDVTIGETGPGVLSVAWSDAYPSFRLQQSTDLLADPWTPARDEPSLDGSHIVTSVPADPARTNLFFRLLR